MLSFKKLGAFLMLSSVFSYSYAHDLSPQIENKLLANGEKYSFDFEDFNVEILKQLLEAQHKINVEIDSSVNTQYTSNLQLIDVTFLDYLDKGANSLNLKVIQLNANKIKLVPNN